MPIERRLVPGGPPMRPYAEQYPPGTSGWQGDPNAPVVSPGPTGVLGVPLAGTGLPNDTIGLLQAILTELRQSDPKGLLYSLTVVIQTPEAYPVTFGPPLLSLSLTCDGGGIVQYRLPNSGAVNWIDLRPNEQITFSFTKPVITSVAFRVLGAPSTVRAVGFY